MRPLSRTASLLVAAGLLGCREVTDANTTPLQSGGDFSIGVTSGATPTFSWAGAGATKVDVYPVVRGGYAAAQWAITSTPSGAIRSPVQYGVTPTGSYSVGSTRTLVKGSPYRVTVERGDGRNAYREFIP